MRSIKRFFLIALILVFSLSLSHKVSSYTLAVINNGVKLAITDSENSLISLPGEIRLEAKVHKKITNEYKVIREEKLKNAMLAASFSSNSNNIEIIETKTLENTTEEICDVELVPFDGTQIHSLSDLTRRGNSSNNYIFSIGNNLDQIIHAISIDFNNPFLDIEIKQNQLPIVPGEAAEVSIKVKQKPKSEEELEQYLNTPFEIKFIVNWHGGQAEVKSYAYIDTISVDETVEEIVSIEEIKLPIEITDEDDETIENRNNKYLEEDEEDEEDDEIGN